MRGIPQGSSSSGAPDWSPAGEALAISRARAGDGEAFRSLVEPYRRELQVLCYRITGSVQDSEDLVQETLLAAWLGLPAFEGRSRVRTWLYRIATNRCLNALRNSARRAREETVHSLEAALPEPSRRRPEPSWLEPYPDALLTDLIDREPGPEARYETMESVSLAFLTALQQLPPKQRVVLVLQDVMGFRAAEVAEMLDTTQAAVTSALKRARHGLESELPGRDRESAPMPGSARERRLVDSFARAFEAGDVESIVALLTEDAWLTMPPLPLEYQGPEAVGDFLSRIALRDGRSHVLVATRANGQPAFGCYLRDPRTPILHAYGVLVLSLSGDRISALTRFVDNSLLAAFGLPRSLRT